MSRAAALSPATGRAAQAGPPVVQRRSAGPAPQVSLASVPTVQRKCSACAALNKATTQVRPGVNVGPVNDRFEREADSIAHQVVAMRDTDAAAPSLAASGTRTVAQRGCSCGSDDSVQRKCATCAKEDETALRMPEASEDDELQARRQLEASEDDELQTRRQPEDEEEEVQPRGAGDGERLMSSTAELTSGGAALPDATRAFFETRMGRDLSGVRLHKGSGADRMNASIGARAFTFRNHIWLNGREGTGPSFTMAHEMAHVLQQTAPGPVGPAPPVVQPLRASAAPHLPQRRAFWLPQTFPLRDACSAPALFINSKKHDLAVNALSGANPKTITEVRIPGASGTGVGDAKCGFADLYQSDIDTVPGVEIKPTADQVPGKSILQPFSIKTNASCKGFWRMHKQRKGNNTRWKHAPNAFPKLPFSNISPAAKAPKDIRIADMKPGHNEKCRGNAKAQIDNYFAGLERVRGVIKSESGEEVWTPGKPRYLGAPQLPNVPENWDPNVSKGKWKVNKMRLHIGPANDYTPAPPVKGRWSMAKDPINTSGVWVYFLAPKPTGKNSIKEALDKNAHPKEFTKAESKLATIIECLRTPPSSKKQPCASPASATPALRRLKGGAASRAPERLVRKTPKGIKAKPDIADTFSLAAWNKLRTGKGATTVTKTASLNTQITTGSLGAIREEAVGKAEMIKAIDDQRASLGTDRAKPLHEKKLLTQGKLLQKFMFWTGVDTPILDIAAAFGVLRQRFGGLFVKFYNGFEKLKARIYGVFRDGKPSSGKSGLGKIAIQVALKILGAIAGKLLPKVANALAECLKIGFSKVMKNFVADSPVEMLVEKVTNAKAEADKLVGDKLEALKETSDALIKPYIDYYNTIKDEAEFVGKIVKIGKSAFDALRLGLCAVGTVGTAGLSCVVAGIDKLLGLIDLSPSEYLMGSLLSSCAAQDLIGAAMLKLDVIKNLPKTIVRKLVETIKKQPDVPDIAKQLLCDPDAIAIDVTKEIKVKDVTCGAGGSIKGTHSDRAKRGTLVGNPTGKLVFDRNAPAAKQSKSQQKEPLAPPLPPPSGGGQEDASLPPKKGSQGEGHDGGIKFEDSLSDGALDAPPCVPNSIAYTIFADGTDGKRKANVTRCVWLEIYVGGWTCGTRRRAANTLFRKQPVLVGVSPIQKDQTKGHQIEFILKRAYTFGSDTMISLPKGLKGTANLRPHAGLLVADCSVQLKKTKQLKTKKVKP